MVGQTINVSALLEFFGLMLTIIISAIVITRAIRKGYQAYIDNKLNVFDMRVTAIEKEIEGDKKQNEKEHDRLTLLFDKIDGKLDKLIENKSA